MAKKYKQEEDYEVFYKAFEGYDLDKEISNINTHFARIFPNENKIISIVDKNVQKNGPAALGKGLDVLYKGGVVDPRGMKQIFEKHTAYTPEELIDREKSFIEEAKIGIVSTNGDIQNVQNNSNYQYKIEKSEALIKDLEKYLGQDKTAMGMTVEESKILTQFVVAHELAHIYYKDNYKTYSDDLPPNFKAITIDKGVFKSLKVADVINEMQADALAFSVVKKMNYNNPNFNDFFEKLITSRLEQSVVEAQRGKFMDSHRFYELYKNDGEFLKKNASNIQNTKDVENLIKKIEKLADKELKRGGINIQSDEENTYNQTNKNSDLVKNRLYQEKTEYDNKFSSQKGKEDWFASVKEETFNFEDKKDKLIVRNYEELQIIDKDKLTQKDVDYLDRLPTTFEKRTPISDGVNVESLYNKIVDKKEKQINQINDTNQQIQETNDLSNSIKMNH